eukprot:10865354-Karenia_brevis.AAC.1
MTPNTDTGIVPLWAPPRGIKPTLGQTNNYQDCCSQWAWAAEGVAQSPTNETGTPCHQVPQGVNTDGGIKS